MRAATVRTLIVLRQSHWRSIPARNDHCDGRFEHRRPTVGSTGASFGAGLKTRTWQAIIVNALRTAPR